MAQPITAPSSLSRNHGKSVGKRLEHAFGRDWKIAALFLLPIVILMVGLILWPFLNAIAMSFSARVNREDVFVGAQNYLRLLDDNQFTGSIVNTLKFTFISVGVKLIVGLVIASTLNSKLPFRNIIGGIMLLPWVVPEVVTALTWRSIFDPIFGGLNPLLRTLGVLDRNVGWLSEPGLAMASVVAVNVWKGIPFYTLLLLAGMKAIDKEQYEAAQVDGAHVLQRFFYITLPGLQYVIAVVVLLSTITTFNTFGLVYLMTGGGPAGETRLYSILAYERAMLQNRFGPGASVSLATAPFLAFVILILARFMRRGVGQSAKTDDTLVDRAFGLVGKGLNAVMSLVMLPIDWVLILVSRGQSSLSRSLASAVSGGQRHTVLSNRQRDTASKVVAILVIAPFLLFVLFPFYWIIITAFKGELQISQRVSLFWPNPWTLDQFQSLLTTTRFTLWLQNTATIAVITTVTSVLFASLGGYALARLKFRGAGFMTTVLLVTYLLPASLLFIPMYRILTGVGAINSHSALFLTYPTFLLPFATWVMLGYYRGIPEDLEEAAMIDGANRLTAFVRITLPLAMPALLAVTLIAFTSAWNEFLYAYIFLTSERLITLPVGLQKLVFADIYPYGQLMAASLIMSIPVVIIYIVAQRFLVEGLTAGSVKG